MYLHLKISDEFDIDELPKNILVRSIDSSMLFKREIFREGNTIVFRNSFDIQRPIYSKEEYFGIKEYFKRIYEVINDRIVLKKKK
jgi:signal peptidase I